MKSLTNPKLSKKELFNLVSGSMHVMATKDIPFVLNGVVFTPNANGNNDVYLLGVNKKEIKDINTGEITPKGSQVAFFADATSLVNEAGKIVELFGDELINDGVEVLISHIKTGKDKTVYRLTLV